MVNSINIIKVGVDGLFSLGQISRATFIETYSDKNTEENMINYLTAHFDEDPLLAQLNNPFSEFYFAKNGDEIAGYLKLNYGTAQTEMQDSNTIEIERIYVLKKFQGQKIGQLLCNKAFQVGQSRNADYLWLGVWEQNTKAIRFYKKYGFFEFGTHIFTLGNDEQKDIMMKLLL